jgi:hypothetical protein
MLDLMEYSMRSRRVGINSLTQWPYMFASQTNATLLRGFVAAILAPVLWNGLREIIGSSNGRRNMIILKSEAVRIHKKQANGVDDLDSFLVGPS